MDLKILYEDNHIIVVYKPRGVLSQADISGEIDMLTILKEYIKNKYNKPGDVFLGLVHRLDRNTSGIMVFARTSKAASRLQEQIMANKFNKEYLAILEGNLPVSNEYVKINNYLLKDEKQNKSFVSNSVNAKSASLEYRILKKEQNTSLATIKLITGRHHQIRATFSNLKHPILGDLKYGSKYEMGHFYALTAYKLSFFHPTLKDELSYEYIGDDIFLKYYKDILQK